MKKIFFILLFMLFTMPVLAEDDAQTKSSWLTHMGQAWHSSDYDLVIPVNTWHNRLTYDKENIDGYNERPWGLGFGKRFYDEDKDLHSFVAMVFLDSHKDPEPIAGYQFQKKWYMGQNDDFSFGLGYSFGLTARSDYDWIPFPYIAPILSFQYKCLSLENTYIPGGRNNGNVLFSWLRIEF